MEEHCLWKKTEKLEYRRIIKLPDRLLNSIIRLLDEKKISFEAAYIISNVIDMDIEYLIKIIDHNPGCKLFRKEN